MNRILLTICTAFIAVTSYAGGLLTNTNQNATFLRNPARDAAIDIDGVYSNPAGVAFMPEGFHFSLSWQAAFQKRQITTNNPLYQLNGGSESKFFEGKSTAPVIPSFQAAYVINDKWSVSAQFAVGGGGGKCEFEQGLPMFEELVGGTMLQNATANGGVLKSFSLNQALTGEQYFYGFQVGGTYKIIDKVSAFAGVRGVLANCSYTGAIKNIAGTIAINHPVAGPMDVPVKSDDMILDCSQDAFGITPIIGIDVNLGKLNLAAKYEFRTKINLENESENSANVNALMPAYADGAKVRSDIPALLTLGAQYSILPNVRVAAGFHYYWDKDAIGTAIKNGDNTWEALLGAEWDINKKWLVSAGLQRTQYGFDDSDMSDLNFNINSTAVCIGGAYKFNDRMKLNVGYMHSFYGEHSLTSITAGSKNLYTRKNDVVGVSFDISF